VIVDTGASLHLENHTGEKGFLGARRPSTTHISTGMTAHAPVDFEGCHVQYVLGDAPDYPIVRMERRNVAMKANFRKALWSPSVAYKESGTQSHFNGRPHLQLANGQRIPIMEVDHLYALPRWTSVAAAEHSEIKAKLPKKV